jgi:hypothetical protein
MAARNEPAGIRSLVYGMGKGKVHIEGLSVSRSLECVSKVGPDGLEPSTHGLKVRCSTD